MRRLEDENISLRNEIDTLKQASDERNRARSIASREDGKDALRTPLAPKSTNQRSLKRSDQVDIDNLTPSELKAEFLRIERGYSKLHDKYANVESALLESNRCLRERTDAYNMWVDHARKLQELCLKRSTRIRKLEARLANGSNESPSSSFVSDSGDIEEAIRSEIPPAVVSDYYAQTDAHISTPTVAPRFPQKAKKAPNRESDPGKPDSSLVPHTPFEPRSPGSNPRVHNLQLVDQEAPSLPPLPRARGTIEEGVYIKSEPSSDTPVVVSERHLRKRKHAGGDKSDIATATRVKVEQSDEMPSTGEGQHFSPHESIDFDTEFHRVETPRKHTKYQSTSDLQPNDEADTERHRSNAKVTRTTGLIRQNGRLTDEVPATKRKVDSRSPPQADASPSLQPLSSRQVLQRTNLGSGGRPQVSPATPQGLVSLAEDGYQDENMNPPSSKRSKPSVLEQLLNGPPTAQGDRTVRPGLPDQEDGARLYLQPPRRRELPFKKYGRKDGVAASLDTPNKANREPASLHVNQNRSTATDPARAEVGKTDIPLRQLQKSKLRLDDFKINPHVNEGYDYAFTDVVRNKDDRACLQGCVRENCCGRKFRALAHAYRAGTRPDELQSLLESYLGDDCHRLRTMSEAEKETVWVEAKMRELANASGKHRHRYPRMSTPPGFWRADFPSTQEGDEYNEEAVELEREIIDERYREAMRPGGLWVFRDE